MFCHVCLGLTVDFSIPSSKPNFDPHLVKDLHSPFRGLFLAIDPQSLIHMKRLNFPLLLLLLTLSSPSYSNKRKVCTCIWRWMSWLPAAALHLPKSFFFFVLFSTFPYILYIFLLLPYALTLMTIFQYFAYTWNAFFSPVKDLFLTQPFLRACYLHEVDFSPPYIHTVFVEAD